MNNANDTYTHVAVCDEKVNVQELKKKEMKK